jgi:hypothetical protein
LPKGVTTLGRKTKIPHIPYTTLGIAASNSTIQPKGNLSHSGQSSERKMEMPRLIGMAMIMAINEVINVPYMNGQACKLLLMGSQLASWVGVKKFNPNCVRARAESRHNIRLIAMISAITINDTEINNMFQGTSPCFVVLEKIFFIEEIADDIKLFYSGSYY